jgi:hypothetical protein
VYKENVSWQYVLAISHGNVGDAVARQKAAAQRNFDSGLTILHRLVELDPTNETPKRAVPMLLEKKPLR